MSVFQTSLFSDVDFEADGKQIGRIALPWSVTRSAYGVVPIPVCVVKNGLGPTALLMAGNHGDEWEGQIALGKLLRSLQPDDVAGRVIILPSANLPAARAGQRVSTLDGGNLNRVFPADPAHGPTHQIAHYIEHRLMAMADVFVDLHSGGGSLDYVPFVGVSFVGDAEKDRRAYGVMRAFGGTYGQIYDAGSGLGATAGTAALRQGCIDIGGEFGGGAVVDPGHLALVERGVRNVLAHMGITPGIKEEPAAAMRLMTSDPANLYTFAPDYGVFVPACRLGDTVCAHDLAGEVHAIEHPERAPIPVHWRAGGLVICQRAIGRVEPGDCLGHLATDIDEPRFDTP
jgi:predicted deacylase